MSSNIYEDPNLTMNVKYSKGGCEDGGQRVERLVDIYHSQDRDRQRGTHCEKHLPEVQTTSFRAAALVLGLLCVLLLVGLTVVSILYNSINQENKQLIISIEVLEDKRRDDSQSLETRCNITEWRSFNCSFYYKSTEMKNWTESRKDCQNRGADLLIIDNKREHDFISEWNKPEASWIGLQPERKNKVDWDWKWVDESPLLYKVWKTGVNIFPQDGNRSRVYIDEEGHWNQTNNGTKRWICEKRLYPV